MLNARNFKIGSRLIATTVGALGLMITFVIIALIGLGKAGDRAQIIAVDNAATFDVIRDMRDAVDAAGMRARNAMLFEEIARQRAEEKELGAALARYRESEQRMRTRLLSSALRDAMSGLPAAQSRAEQALQRLFTLVAEGSRPAMEQHFEHNLVPALDEWQKRLGTLVGLQRQANDEALAEIAAIREEARLILFGLIVFAVLVMIPSGLWVTRGITRPLGQAVDIAGAVAAGKFDNPIEIGGRDEPAHLLQSLARMQDDLAARTASERRVAAETLRIKVALDVGSNCVTLVDGQGLVAYANDAMLTMLRAAESDLRAVLPEFQAMTLNAGSFQVARLHPELAAERLRNLESPWRAEIEIGRRVFALVATPVIDAAGQRLSTVIEWLDRTGEIATERDVAAIVEAAANGDFARRIVLADKHGFFLQVSTAINRLLETNSQALQAVGQMLARLAQGDLTEKIETEYQGDLERVRGDANGAIDQLREIVISVKQVSDAINTAALEIAQGNQDLSARTEHQASSLQQTASSMEELTSTVLQNASTAQRAHGLAEDARSVAETGGEVVGQVVATMSAIQQSSNRIADIIGVIDGIAFQTNILALNAAVEAARAGEQGRGFAVVASEVRNLAQRSAAAAKEIKGLIDDSVGKVAAGNRLVDQAGDTMQNVVSSVQMLARLMADISHASREQSSGIEQVGQAITQMDEVTQQNAALVEEAAAAAESLQEQAESLVSLVSVFRLAQVSGGGWSVAQEPAALRAPAFAGQRRPAQSQAQRLPVLSGELEPLSAAHPPALPASLPVDDDDDWAEF